MDRDQFLTQLERLTPKEIAERLSSWDAEQLGLLQEYLRSKGLEQPPAARTQTSTKDDGLRLSVETAQRAHTMATMAVIFSVGAMLAAIAAAVVAFLALGGSRISW